MEPFFGKLLYWSKFYARCEKKWLCQGMTQLKKIYIQSYDKKLELKPKQREALIYLVLRKGDFAWQSCAFGRPRVMGTTESLGCNWWKNMHQIDA